MFLLILYHFIYSMGTDFNTVITSRIQVQGTELSGYVPIFI